MARSGELPNAKRHPIHDRPAHQGPQPLWAASTWLRLAQDRQHVPRRLGMGRRAPLQGGRSCSRRTSAAHLRPHGRPLARARSSPTPRRAPGSTTSTTWPKTICQSSRHHAAARRQPASRRTSIDSVGFAYTFNDAKAKDRKHTQYFEVMGDRSAFITTAGSAPPSARAACRGRRACSRASANGPPIRTNGSFIIWKTTGRRPTTWPTRCRRSWRT